MAAEAGRDAGGAASAIGTGAGRLTTGAKLFVILSVALLPLALIAVVATLQTGRLADAQVRARLRLAADESARAVAIELGGDLTVLRSAAFALARDPADTQSCARLRGIFGQPGRSDGRGFAVLDRRGGLLCGEPLPAVPGLAVAGKAGGQAAGPAASAALLPGRGLVIAEAYRGGPQMRAFFSRRFLTDLAEPSTHGTSFAQSVVADGDQLDLSALPGARPLERTETALNDLGIAGLSLRTSVRAAPITSSFVVALLLPLLMWAAAAGIAWLVVDRLLIEPLRRLRASVADYRPGEVIEAGARALPAQEIRELSDTFRAISRTVALHEQGLAEGLVRQTKLTREVHHRVKNNLQVISSLINFHARGAPTPEAADAYASIQRRVDALAVVHRNHFAEMEDSRGLPIRSVLGELASNIRATAPPGGARLSIALDVENFLVSQDVAVAIAFLVTEAIELSTSCDAVAPIRVTLRGAAEPGRARLRVASCGLAAGERLRELTEARYGRIMQGLSRQLRSRLAHDPAGFYEIDVPVLGHD